MNNFTQACRCLLPTACCLLFSVPLLAQTPYYALPMQLPVALSANFAELRPNHLHSGVDFRTEGREGEPVYAVAPGYVERLVIRPDGYGKALYLRHTNGAMSVYAHLRSFVPPVAEWARQQQYSRQAFYLDTELDTSLFPVQRGDLIGYSGNSGRSFGPHLHFEIRDANQLPLNMFREGIYACADRTPPQASSLAVYRFDTVQGAALSYSYKTLTIKQLGNSLRLAAGDTIGVGGSTYFGLNMLDRMDNSSSTYGVSRCEMRLNDSLVFSYQMDKFSFDETRYVNAMLDFAKKPSNVVRLYVAPGNRLSTYRGVKNSGVIALKNNERAKVSIALYDDAGNASQLQFWVKNTENFSQKKLQLTKNQHVIKYNRANTHEVNGCKIGIPAGALYEHCIFELQTLGAAHGSASPVFVVKQPSAPPHRAVSVGVKAAIPERLRSKASLVCMDKKGQKEALSTSYQAPYFVANARSWGYFFVEIDTLPPQIAPVNFAPNARLGAHQTRITLRVKDKLSGLKRYEGRIDGSWALFEYDAKTDYMTYEIDPTRVKTGAQHALTFTATDGVGNVAEFACGVYF